MSSITNVNNNSSIVTVGRTTPVSPGQQPAEKSIPVVLASDQTPVPVEEQNKVQSEVALSLLGIPRAEVALGIFADVNTYDVNPSEWSSAPEFYLAGHGIKHLPNEAGALVEAPRNKTAVLTSKRFFRYQPGRVSAATFGIKATISASDFAKNPVIRKYGIFDNFDGYYWEVRNSGVQDNFSAIRRTQSVSRAPSTAYGVAGQTIKRGPTNNPQGGDPIYVDVTQTDDYRFCGQGEKEIVTSPNLSIRDRDVLSEYRYLLADKVYEAVEVAYQGNSYSALIDETGGTFAGTGAADTSTTVDGIDVSNFYYDLARGIYGSNNITNDAASLAKVLLVKDKCKRDFDYWIDFFLLDLEWGGTAHTVWNLTNFTTALIPNYAEFEGLVYTKLLDAVQPVPSDAIFDTDFTDAFDISTDAHTKLDSYVDIISANLEAASNHYTVPVVWTSISGLDYGSKGVIDTFYDVKRNYWGYFVSVFKDTPASDPFAGAPLDWTSVDNPYTNNDPAAYVKPDGVGGFVSVTDDTEVVYTSSYGKEFTLADIKYKCQRDIAEYVVTGFKNDISGGGNSQTKYNMSMYYQGSGLSVGSQGVNEKERHEYLSKLIDFDLFDKLGYSISQATRITQTSLSKKVVDNFDDENVETLISGVRGFAGNLIALRDGLLMVHAGVYDPNLLKEKKKIRVECSTDNRLKLTSGTVTIGQHVRFAQAGANVAAIGSGEGNLEPGKLYRVASVIGPKGNEFTLETVTGYGEDFGNNSGYNFTPGGVNKNILPVEFTVANFDVAEDNDGSPENIYFETVVPFMMPDQPTSIAVGNEEILYGSYDPAVYRNDDFLARVGAVGVTEITPENDPFPQGMMFPYMYSSGTGMPVKVTEKGTNLYLGYVNTALDTTTNAELEELRDQIDVVNFIPEYINWVKNNVKPEYWGVYEYRVPRSRYSFDKLDGVSGQTANHTGRLYSDVATGDVGIVRPGQIYAPGGEWQSADSVYSFDFTKVTMLKIEFSWYGAVGALFLAYVPVDNGEARWVRVHHLRASNQLKIASLGNATLPITYNVYGGGDSRTLGDGEEAITPAGANYETTSHNIVKYGASYYIDGGDRGTVRLYSHNNESLVASKGKIWDVGSYGITGSGSTFTLGSPTWSGTPKDDVNSTFFMGALLKTDSPADQNIRVVYTNDLAAGAGGTVTFSSPPAGSTASFQLLVDRAAMTYGLEAKKVILSTQEGNAVRNRVQVYPTKMSTANGGNNVVRLRMKKTPIFQTTTVTSGTLQLSSAYVITSENLPLAVTESAAPYLKNGEAVYGWFRGIIDETSAISVFGRLYKEANLYYFDAQTTASGIIVLDASSNFLADRKFDYLGTEYSGVTRGEEEKEGLSSVLIITDPVVPIPGTGTNVATLYLQQGTEQFDLAAYFDYNKEYLSFPLTDNTESLYLAVDSDQLVDDPVDNISIGITWEEQ